MKKRIVTFPLVLVIISLFAGFSYLSVVDSFASAKTTALDPVPSEEPGPGPIAVGTEGVVPERPRVYSTPSTRQPDQLEAADAPVINAWYGGNQKFGQNGVPQRWVNIVGNVSGLDKNSTLKYSLNGGPEQDLSFGPDSYRLEAEGDFNIEIDYADLDPGYNTVEIIANDGEDETQTAVDIFYTDGKTWPRSTTVDWTSSGNLLDIAQPVDGYWQTDGNSVKIDADNMGFDRLLAIGDRTWTNYEVEVPVTVYGLYEAGNQRFGSGVGFILRWQGHESFEGEQPGIDWSKSGALGWYAWSSQGTEQLEMRNNENKSIGVYYGDALEFGKTYIFKMSTQTDPSDPDQRAYYRLKYWEAGTEEPFGWNLKGYTSASAQDSGSLLLLAHNVEAKFGQVIVRDLDTLRLKVNVSIDGQGDYRLDPDQEDFSYSQRVIVYAFPDEGHDFAGWTGDYEGVGNPAQFNIHKDMNITVHFVPKPPSKLKINIEGQGSVTKTPNKSEYPWGEEVELTAIPAGNQVFLRWTGDVTGIKNPTTIKMDGDKEVTAVFGSKSEVTPRSDDFSGCVLNTNLWDVIDPVGDASVQLANNRAKLVLPAGVEHNMWQGNTDALRLMQPTDDLNFEVEVKFDALPEKRYQMQGLLIEQDDNNWLRFDIYHDGSNLYLNAGRRAEGSFLPLRTTSVNPGGSKVVYLRLERNGDRWLHTYSFDGANWTTFTNPRFEMSVAATGVFAGNKGETGPGTEPAFNALVDYFFNTAIPIEPEDQGNTINLVTEGQGQVQIDPVKQTYSCNEKVTLTATPARDWSFANWSGDVSSNANPFVLTVKGDYEITANFTQGNDVYLPSIMRSN